MTSIEYVDSHTGGEPTRTIIAGGPDLGPGTLAQKLEVFRRDSDHIRSATVNEPRGSDVMVGALLVEPNGVIFFNNVGYLGMCGHGAIGVIATSPMAMHQAAMLPDWGPTTLFLNDAFTPSADELALLARRGTVKGDAYGSPDGLWFSQKTGVLYIQTDDGAFTDTTNCMLVAAVPGEVGDGETVTVDNTAGGAGTVSTRVGAVGTLRRLLVGPVESEITGLTESGDGKALFINIQHPGEDGSNAAPTSSWPYPQADGSFGNPAAGEMPNQGNRPRSATIVLTRIDGGLIGQ